MINNIKQHSWEGLGYSINLFPMFKCKYCEFVSPSEGIPIAEAMGCPPLNDLKKLRRR